MQFKRVRATLVAAAVSAALLMPSTAFAVSLPYVDDVNDWGEHKVIATVVARGEGKLTLKAKCGGKRLKVTKHHRGVWTVVFPTGEDVKFTAKDDFGKRTIGYRIY